jgi:hemin uptake protein HemP
MEPLRIEAGELSAEEILTALREGRRVIVTTEMLGGSHTVTLRHDGSTYYCDTPTTLHKHTEEEEMRTCIDRMGYAKPVEAE